MRSRERFYGRGERMAASMLPGAPGDPPRFSKPLRKADEASKQLIIELLEGTNTHGIDIESLYHHPGHGGWVVFEFLKCDTVRPHQSHPRRYWRRNWRKFSALWALVQRLQGRLYLVNYEESREQFRLIHVKALAPGEAGGIADEEVRDMDAAAFRAWFRQFNDSAGEPWRTDHA